MLDAMVRLGSMLARGEDDLLLTLVQPMPSVQGKDPYIVWVNIDTHRPQLEFQKVECRESDRERLAEELLWVGNAAGPNSPQWTATTNSLRYILSQTIVNLQQMLPDGSSLKTTLSDIQAHWMVDLGPQRGPEERYRYVLDLVALGFLHPDEWKEVVGSRQTNPEETIRGKTFIPDIEKRVMQAANISSNRVVLWSLCIDGKRIVDHPDYRELVVHDRILNIFAEEASPGICSACGAEDLVTANFTRMKFKYYNTDKISFASGVRRERFNRNLVVCSTCYKALLAAEAFVHGHMRTQIGHLRFYVIPEILGPNSSEVDPRAWTRLVRHQVQSVVNFAGIADLEDEIQMDQEEYGYLGYVVNLLFHVWNNAELRLYNLVRDVPRTRFQELRRAFRRYERLGEDLFGPRGTNQERIRWTPDFTALYRLIPVTRTNRSEEYRRVLQLFDALLTGQAISYRTLMESFCKLIQIHRFGRYASTNVMAPQAGFELSRLSDDVLLANMVLSMLQDLKQLMGSPFHREAKDVQRDTHLDADAFLRQVGYRASQEALFWLGAAVCSVATAQWNNNLKTMPVLEKINYRGMSAADVIRLVGKIEEAFQQYKLFQWSTESEALFRMHFAFAQALETNPPRWKAEYRLTDEEAVFYILTGFAYRRKQILSHRRQNTQMPESLVGDSES
ncbi:type I-B CRISPR-associated protein Cas8b/Csh1 [Alicyclobacillus kakegawensis]|uniref:type I-B CRISPR-associated protein Cas8b/Csh1 n=1 Tax=Alicyclobacillus kakegawensis TaxID=392012 RepID=UPI00083700C1|nr:type I-B CRISPR-associated protein Cas8b/Csh1 [Alicyclobacillus kakegawensis]